MPGRLRPGGLDTEELESVRVANDPKHRDRVVAAVAGIEKRAVWMDRDLGAGKASAVCHVGRERGDGLAGVEFTSIGIVAEGGDCQVELVDTPGSLTIGMKGEVPRAGAGLQFCRPTRRDRCPAAVEAVNEDPIQA